MRGSTRGTHDALLDASQFIATLEKRQGLTVACPEEIAFRQGWIDAAQLAVLAQPLAKGGYGNDLLRLVEGPGVLSRSSTRPFLGKSGSSFSVS
jgi:glucose-1-phosphate thymidylyltransferase